MNRTLVSDIADLHFSPTRANAENLRREAIRGEIFITGNTAIDAMGYTVKKDRPFQTAAFEPAGLCPSPCGGGDLPPP